ncbi:MAG: Crp/Fnr family transcriptional regulator [Myxococcota bacterium]
MSLKTTPPNSAFAALLDDIERCDVSPSSDEWHEFSAQCAEVRFEKGREIFGIGAVPEGLLFVSDGIAAAELIIDDGRSIIYRFFEAGQMCTTITAAWYGTETADSIAAVAAVTGIVIPLELWKATYLYGGNLGVYLRKKALESLLFDKELLRVKTLNSTAASYDLLGTVHDRVLERVSQKDIARFVGVTPEGLSRFLKHRKP